MSIEVLDIVQFGHNYDMLSVLPKRSMSFRSLGKTELYPLAKSNLDQALKILESLDKVFSGPSSISLNGI